MDPASDDHAQVRSSTPAPSSSDDRKNQGGKRSVQPSSQPEQSEINVSSGVKRDAGGAELPDEYEQGGKFQQVEGLTTVDAEEIPCEFSVDDDFEVEETAEGVDETRHTTHDSQLATRNSTHHTHTTHTPHTPLTTHTTHTTHTHDTHDTHNTTTQRHNHTHDTHQHQHNTSHTTHNTNTNTTHNTNTNTNIDISFHGLRSHVICHRLCLKSQTVLEQKQWNRSRRFALRIHNRIVRARQSKSKSVLRCAAHRQVNMSCPVMRQHLPFWATQYQSSIFCSMESPVQAKMGCNNGQWDVVEDLYRRHLMVPSCLLGTLRVFLTLFWTASLCDREVCAWRFSRWVCCTILRFVSLVVFSEEYFFIKKFFRHSGGEYHMRRMGAGSSLLAGPWPRRPRH